MPFGSNTFFYGGGGGVIQNILMPLRAREENVFNKKNSPSLLVTYKLKVPYVVNCSKTMPSGLRVIHFQTKAGT